MLPRRTLSVISRAAWLLAYHLILPPFHHPLRQALRRAGLERHQSLAKW